MATVKNAVTGPGEAAFVGESAQFNGVLGYSTANGHAGVAGVCDSGNSNGVYGRSKDANGVIGFSSSTGHAGVVGANDDGDGNGIYGRSAKSDGVAGVTTGDGKAGVAGVCDVGNGNGVYGRSSAANGVVGSSSSNDHAGVAGVNDTGVGIYGKGGRRAGSFDGDVDVTGKLFVRGDVQLAGGDVAEEFGVVGARAVEPGSVVVLVGDDRVRVSDQAYDPRVAGVVSGAGGYRPALVLDRRADADRCPLALTGKVWCKVDADFAPVELGNLLTTSATPGHAMRVSDPNRAFGAVIGKALGSMRSGRGLLPVLVALQ